MYKYMYVDWIHDFMEFVYENVGCFFCFLQKESDLVIIK